MTSEEKLRYLDGSIDTLIETANRLQAHAKVAFNDPTKRENLQTAKNNLDGAVSDCNQRFLDFKDSLS